VDEITCRQCGIPKPRTDFPKDRNRVRTRCKPCFRLYVAEWRNRPGKRERQVEHRRRATLAKFGLTAEHYDLMLTAQGGACAICEQPPDGKPLCVDHDHATNRVRALLCVRCNFNVGLVENRRRHWRSHEAAVAAYLAVYGDGSPFLPAGVGVEPLRRVLRVVERHPNGPGNYRLTVEQVAQIRERYAAGGVSQRALGREFGVAHTTIIRIVHGDAWRKVAAVA
jgi:hypothetical protein